MCNFSFSAVLLVVTAAVISISCVFIADVSAKPLARAMSARQSESQVKQAFDSLGGVRGGGIVLVDRGESDDAGVKVQSELSLGEACELLVSELKTASADFSQYMNLHCPGISAETPRDKMPENCQQSLDEAYELFDLYDTLLQHHCRSQYEALFATSDLEKHNVL